MPGVEEVDGCVYRRAWRGSVLSLTFGPGGVSGDAELLEVADPGADVAAIDAHLRGELPTLVDAAPGLRVPGTIDGAELAVRAVLGQQVSVAGARTLAGRLAAAYGRGLPSPTGAVVREFPSMAALAVVDPGSLPMPRARAAALVGLAAALADGMPLTRENLLRLRGIGPWTADYVAMRALRDPDILLLTDLGVRAALRALGVTDAAALAARCRPYASYATMHLWHSLSGGESGRAGA